MVSSSSGVAAVCYKNGDRDRHFVYCQELAKAPQHKMFAWGYGVMGQLGQGDGKNKTKPVPVVGIDGNPWRAACGLTNTAVITTEGKLYTWGCGQDGQLAHGVDSRLNALVPARAEGLPDDKKVVGVSLGESHSVAVMEDGSAWAWGKNNLGQCGCGVHAKSNDNLFTTGRELPKPYSPGEVKLPAGKKVMSAASGSNHTVAVCTDGSLLVWGSGWDGQLGTGNRRDVFIPVEPEQGEMSGEHNTIGVSCGQDFSAVVSSDGELYTFGSNQYGQLGVGDGCLRSSTPLRVRGPLEERKIVKVACGGSHMAAVTDEGELYTWGYGRDGNLGHGDKADVGVPKLVEALKGKRIVDVAAGGGHTMTLDDKGVLYVFGRGRDGQLGRGDNVESVAAYRPVPVVVDYFGAKKLRVNAIACGNDHSVALAA
ncbi:hypothetical protein FOL46_003559 [Perkinsus olseni]|uniref:RCC1-like domain-containing protein n=1 Tax=Perkinsus olseni TaxID=32597 RepID=A0A7J6M3F7_PEROL|nr:hypothetical protein FOL46_003559 [Perkinsus olseni]